MIDDSLTKYSTDKPLQEFKVTGDLAMGGFAITGVKNGVNPQDVPSYSQLTSGLATKYTNTVTVNNIAKASGDLDLNGNKVTNAGNPVQDQDLATKKYCDDSFALKGDVPSEVDLSKVSVTDLVPPLVDLNLNGFRIKSVG